MVTETHPPTQPLSQEIKIKPETDYKDHSPDPTLAALLLITERLEANPDQHLTTPILSLGVPPINLSTKAKAPPFVRDVEPQPQTHIPVPSND